jgi:biopolymer transport protein ExbD
LKQSLRSKRKNRHHKRLGQGNKLNLVALMDIFTILVFFLMVNQSEVRVLQKTEELKLPVSIAEQLPFENIIVSVLKDSILVQGRLIWQNNASDVSLSLSESSVEALSSALKTELAYQTKKRTELTEHEKLNGRAVTIIGDASVEYSVLKHIMGVCAEADYRNMSLAVERISSTDNSGGVK